ncbi:MAG TPA: S8 family serine peptidase [Streptosporangiaceae bacterium]
MLTGGPARRAVGGLLVLTAVGAGPVLAAGQPALADSVRSAQQWVLDAVDAPTAWPVTQGSGVLVAVIDSGVRPDVSDLAGSVTSGPDLSGVSTPTSDANWGMHGTWMASLIAGHGHGSGGGDGISGVAPQAKILSIRVLPDKKDPGYSQYKHQSPSRGQHALAQAIRYAVAHHANVISMSLGYGASSRVVRSALQDATRHGVVVVASSGNSGTSASDEGKAHAPYSFPADYPGVLGVAAVDRSGSPARFSSDNLSVQIAAPGVKVPAQGSDGQYWLVSGTSPACALTAGVAALIKSVYPHLAPALVIRAITVSAQNQPKQGYDDRVGFGTLDAAVALATAGKLTGFGVTGRGIGVHSHFGGGPKAIPPAPVGTRGTGQLMLFGGLAVACLIVSLIAAGRLMLFRRRTAQDQQAAPPPAPPPGPAYPAPLPPAPSRPGAQPDPARPAPAYPAAQPPASPATAWWSQDNGTRPPDPAPAPLRGQQDRTVAGPQRPWSQQLTPLPQPEPPRTEPSHAEPSHAEPPGTELPGTEPHWSPSSPPPVPSPGWPGPSSRAEAPPSPAGPAAAAGPAAPRPASAAGAPSPSGMIPDWLAATPPSVPSTQTPWPDDDDVETTSPSGIPPVRAELADSPSAGPLSAGAPPSAWPAPAGPPSAGSPSAGPPSAGPPSPGASSAGALRSAWPSPSGPPSAGSPPAGSSPADSPPSAWSPPGGPPPSAPPSAPGAVRAERAAGPAAASSPSADSPPSAWSLPGGPSSAALPSAPGPVRPGSASAGSAGPSRYLQGLGRPSPSGRHAARRDHPQPAPAWARNRPPGSQDNDGADPDPQDES